MRFKHISYILSALLFLSTLACSDGEDGMNGANGINGINGTNGTNGENGQNGEDGQNAEGFNQLTEYGAITLTLEGTRIDDEPFTDENTFKFAPVSGFSINFTNEVVVTDQGDDTITSFTIARFLSTPEDVLQQTAVVMGLLIANLGTEDEEILNAGISILDYAVIGEDNKYFVMDDGFALTGDGSEGVTDFIFSDLAYDPETNNLTFSYSLTVDGENNDTGNELSISGTADVIVLDAVE